MKAIVMETRGKKAAILLKDGTFRTVRGRYSVGETIEYRETVHHSSRKWMAVAAAVVLMIALGGGLWYDAGYVAYAEVSLDVNPSIVYTINKRAQVLEVRAVNSEAFEAVNALKEEGLRFMPLSQAIDRTMALFESEGYLDADNEDYVLMNISTDSAGLQTRLASEINSGMELAMERDPSTEYRVDHSDRATAKRAAQNNMSTGRYAVWEQEGGDSEPEKYAEMPIRELMGKSPEINPEKSEESSAPETEKAAPFAPIGGQQDQNAPSSPDQAPSDTDQSPDGPMPSGKAQTNDNEPLCREGSVNGAEFSFQESPPSVFRDESEPTMDRNDREAQQITPGRRT